MLSAGQLDPFSQDCLDAHNNFRAKHGVPPLMWSHDLAEGAQNWADQLASTDSLQHDQVAIQNRKIGKRQILKPQNFRGLSFENMSMIFTKQVNLNINLKISLL